MIICLAVTSAFASVDGAAIAAPISRLDAKTAGSAVILSVESLGVSDRGSVGLESLEVAVEAFRNGDLDASLGAFRQAVDENKDLPPAKLMLARLLLVTGQTAAGRAALEQAAVDHANSPDVFLLLGDLARSEGRLSDAMLNFERSLALASEPSTEPAQVPEPAPDKSASPQPPNHRAKVAATLSIASVFETRQQWPQADSQLRAAVKLGAEGPAVLSRLARVQFALENHEVAEKLLRRAHDQDPQSEPVEIILGQWFHTSGQKDAAARWVQSALQSHPQDRRVLNAAVLWALEVERFDDAAGYVQRLATLAAEDPDVIRMQGLVARFRGDLKSAETHFQRLLVDYPGDFLASNQLAVILVESDQAAKQRRALQLAESTYRQYPQSLDARVSLGWIHHRLGHSSEADSLFSPIVGRTLLTGDSAYFVADYLQKRGKADLAEAVLSAALAAPGAFATRQSAIALLQSLQNEREAE